MLFRSRYEEILRRIGDTHFVGYERLVERSNVLGIIGAEGELKRLGAGERGAVVVARTPFYAERGGQVGDTGEICAVGGKEGILATVVDTQRPVGAMTLHLVEARAPVAVGDEVELRVDATRRADTMRNHTATHLLHRAIRIVTGPDSKQRGSLVHPGYLRFDYPLDRALTREERDAVEAEVRRAIREDMTVVAAEMSMADAVKAGADAFFDEKYGETVRTIRMEEYSHELCRGTHCRATGQVGSFVITAERSIGSGLQIGRAHV